MSKFEDRVRGLIDDRVNDLERLFLATPENPGGGSSMEDCCKDVLSNIRQLKQETDKVLKEIERLPKDGLNQGEIYKVIKESIDQSMPDLEVPEGNTPEDAGLDPTDGWINQHGMPHSLKDFLEIIGAVLGGYTAVNSWPKFLRWLFKLLPYLLSTGYALIPLLTLITSLWRGIKDSVDNGAAHVDRVAIMGDLDKLKQKVDDIARLLAELSTSMQPGSETSMLIDRLRDLQNALKDYYEDVSERITSISNHLNQMHIDMDNRFDLLAGDQVMIRSDLACIAHWLKGERNCDDYTIDIYTMIDTLNSTAQRISCNLDEYYQSLVSSLASCCSTMQQRMNELEAKIDACHDYFTNPGNPIDKTHESIERGNVVGSGSIVLNLDHDLKVIKSQLTEIRRLL